MVAPLAILLVPFVLWSPHDFLFSAISWYGISSTRVWLLRPDWVTQSFGLTGLLFSLGMGGWRLALQVVLQLCVDLVAWKRVRCVEDCIPFMALALLLFYMTVPVPYGYIYSEPILLASFAILGDLRSFLGPAGGRGRTGPVGQLTPYRQNDSR